MYAFLHFSQGFAVPEFILITEVYLASNVCFSFVMYLDLEKKFIAKSMINVIMFSYFKQLVKGLQQELNRLYSLFCSRNPDFEEKGGKVSIVSHSLGCVITYDIMTGWNPVRLYEQLLQKEEELPDERWMSYEERHLLDELYITKRR